MRTVLRLLRAMGKFDGFIGWRTSPSNTGWAVESLLVIRDAMLVIFDCDGVLVDSEHLVNKIEAALLSQWGWPLSAEQARAAFKGRAFRDIAKMIEQNASGSLPYDWIYEWAMETARGFHERLQEVPGVRSVLEQLQTDATPMCVASQSSLARVRLSLAICKVDHYFADRVFTASMVTRPKPAPDLFLHAARVLKFEPADCVVIEDSRTGVEAAVAAGMRVYGFAMHEDALELERAGATVFHRMSDLKLLLDDK